MAHLGRDTTVDGAVPPVPQMPTDLMPLAEAAAALGLKLKTLRYWIDVGKIGKWRRGGHWVYVSPAQIQEAMNRFEYVPPKAGEQAGDDVA